MDGDPLCECGHLLSKHMGGQGPSGCEATIPQCPCTGFRRASCPEFTQIAAQHKTDPNRRLKNMFMHVSECDYCSKVWEKAQQSSEGGNDGHA